MDRPFFSLITPVLNAGATLRDTIASVQRQDGADFEWIVQDGGSTDGCLDLWKGLPQVQLEIAADSGLYDAMNRAVNRSRGKWIVFLQADDWLEPRALAAFQAAAAKNPSAQVLTGGCSAVREIDGAWRLVWERNRAEEKVLHFSSLALGEPMLNARAYRRDLWEMVGGFHAEWSLAADRAWLLQLVRKAAVQAMVAEKVYRYRWHEGSRTMNDGNNLSRRLSQENMEVAVSLLPGATEAEKDILRCWHTKEAVRLCMNELEVFDFKGLAATLPVACRVQPTMPLALTAEILRCLPGFLLRGGRTRSSLASSPRTKATPNCF